MSRHGSLVDMSLISSVRRRTARDGRTLWRPGVSTVVAAAAAAMIVGAGLILWGTPADDFDDGYGRLRDYPDEPTTAWMIDDSALPGYTGDGGIDVVGSYHDSWLISYQQGLGHAYTLIDSETGKQLWDSPVDAGFGSCALTEQGTIGCAIDRGGEDVGFYSVDRSDGDLHRVGELDGTSDVFALGDNFLRVNRVGYDLSLRTPDGKELWQRKFGDQPHVAVADDLVHVSVPGEDWILDPATGADQLSCRQCEITAFPDFVVVASTGLDAESVTIHPRTAQGLGDQVAATAHSDDRVDGSGMKLVSGPAMRAVLTAAGSRTLLQDSGTFWIVDPATTTWKISDSELSKSQVMPCGKLIAFGRKDGSRAVFTVGGDRVGPLPRSRLDETDENLDYAECVGSSDKTLVTSTNDQLTGWSPADGRIGWRLPLSGTAHIVDGYLVLAQHSTLTKLIP